ncbi:hypothetical protein FACS1894151_01710 [Spirochaetia bacterium]|nr:hypothetical protein FACS1894151_01710 [Spirochaetia bacterium]
MFFGVIAILTIFIGTPAIIGYAVYKIKQDNHETERLRIQKEIQELELAKERIQIERLELESRRYDSVIDSANKSGINGDGIE